MTKSHDTGPHDSTDPTYTDTWYWNTIDVDTGIVVWSHISWRPAVGSGQHLVALVHPTGVQRLRADVTDPFHSDLLDIEIVDPWNVSRVSCPAARVGDGVARLPPRDRLRRAAAHG